MTDVNCLLVNIPRVSVGGLVLLTNINLIVKTEILNTLLVASILRGMHAGYYKKSF